jgi:hypothetical protein
MGLRVIKGNLNSNFHKLMVQGKFSFVIYANGPKSVAIQYSAQSIFWHDYIKIATELFMYIVPSKIC